MRGQDNSGAVIASTMLGGTRRFSILPITTTHMRPTMVPGDAAIVDPKVASYEGAGLYVLEQLGKPAVYRVDNNNTLVATCDDGQFAPQEYTLAQFNDCLLGKVRLILKVADREWAEKQGSEN